LPTRIAVTESVSLCERMKADVSEAAIQRDGRPFRSLVSYARFQTAARFSLCFTREENSGFLGQAIFAKQKTKKAEQENDRHVIKATKEISMQHLILLAVVSMMVLYVLIIVGCLCYVGRHGRRTS
jgi:hypothetical protein